MTRRLIPPLADTTPVEPTPHRRQLEPFINAPKYCLNGARGGPNRLEPAGARALLGWLRTEGVCPPVTSRRRLMSWSSPVVAHVMERWFGGRIGNGRYAPYFPVSVEQPGAQPSEPDSWRRPLVSLCLCHDRGLDEPQLIRAALRRHGLVTALKHFENAEAAFGRDEWESANSQVRSYLEALFEGVAAIRLHAQLTGGEARKRLEAEGVIGEREGPVVRRVMELAGGRGSHAGISDPDHSASIRLLGLGIARLGLALIPNVIRVEDVFAIQLRPPRGGALPADRHIETSCPSCRETQTLAEAEVSRSAGGTIYPVRTAVRRS